MKIREKSREYSVEVYGLYWVDGVRYHLIIPYNGYNGLIVVNDNKCEVTDSSIDNFIIKKGDYGRDILVNSVLERSGLIYRLVDHDPEAMIEFKRLLEEDRPLA